MHPISTASTLLTTCLKIWLENFQSAFDEKKQETRALGGALNADFAKVLQIMLLSAPESRILTRSCPNLNQLFLVAVLMLPKNSITICPVLYQTFSDTCCTCTNPAGTDL